MANRVTDAIKKCEEQIQSRLSQGLITQKQIDDAQKGLDMEFAEYSHFQTEKSLASMDGRLTLDEAQLVYIYLGESLSTFNGQSLAVKRVLNEVFASLLKSSMARR